MSSRSIDVELVEDAGLSVSQLAVVNNVAIAKVREQSDPCSGKANIISAMAMSMVYSL